MVINGKLKHGPDQFVDVKMRFFFFGFYTKTIIVSHESNYFFNDTKVGVCSFL